MLKLGLFLQGDPSIPEIPNALQYYNILKGKALHLNRKPRKNVDESASSKKESNSKSKSKKQTKQLPKRDKDEMYANEDDECEQLFVVEKDTEAV